MSETLRLVADLIQRGEVRVCAHGYDELAADGILAREVIDGVQAAIVVEDYPTYGKAEETMNKRPHTKLVREGQYGGRRRAHRNGRRLVAVSVARRCAY
jgi:hypothetical protein